ncbi:hypothetical protein RCL1_007898 [Eukaryota sp. TZLM3-RCL]
MFHFLDDCFEDFLCECESEVSSSSDSEDHLESVDHSTKIPSLNDTILDPFFVENLSSNVQLQTTTNFIMESVDTTRPLSPSSNKSSSDFLYKVSLQSEVFSQTPTEICQHISQVAHEYGFDVSIKRTRKNRSIEIVCKHSGSYRKFAYCKGKYSTSTVKDNCPFKMNFKFSDGRWLLETNTSVLEHDHNLIQNRAVMPGYTRQQLSGEVGTIAHAMLAASISASDILTVLRKKFPNIELSLESIHSFRRTRGSNVYVRKTVEELIQSLHDENFIVRVNWNDSNEISHLLFISKDALTLFNQRPYVLQLDCTYKTNRAKLPLLTLVSTTPLNTIFHLGFCFMIGETAMDYMWALENIRNIINCPDVILTDRDRPTKENDMQLNMGKQTTTVEM